MDRRWRGEWIASPMVIRVALAVCAVASPGTARAEDPMTVRLEQLPGARFGLAELTRGKLTVLADGVTCASITPRSQAGALVVGAAGQPAACRREGSELEFENGAGQMLHETGTLRAGSTLALRNFAPRPPHAAAVHRATVGGATEDGDVPAMPFALAAGSLLAALVRGARRVALSTR